MSLYVSTLLYVFTSLRHSTRHQTHAYSSCCQALEAQVQLPLGVELLLDTPQPPLELSPSPLAVETPLELLQNVRPQQARGEKTRWRQLWMFSQKKMGEVLEKDNHVLLQMQTAQHKHEMAMMSFLGQLIKGGQSQHGPPVLPSQHSSFPPGASHQPSLFQPVLPPYQQGSHTQQHTYLPRMPFIRQRFQLKTVNFSCVLADRLHDSGVLGA